MGGENPVSAFMQGYQFVNNLQRQDAADQQDQQTQALRTQLMQGQIDAQNLQNQNATTAAANAATATANQKQVNTNKAIMAQLASNADPDALHANFSDEELNGAFGPLLNHPLLAQYATPEGRMQFKQGYNTFAAALPSDANNNTFNQDQAKTGFTQMFKPQIMAQVQGKVPNAVDADVATIYPAQGRPGSFYTTLNVKKADGSSEIVPWTMNGTNDPDDKVKPFDISRVMDVAQRNALLVHHLDLQDAKMGDQGTLARMDAQGQNQALLDQVDQLPQGMPPDQQRQAITRTALQAGRGMQEAGTLGANLSPEDKTLGNMERGQQIFNSMLPSLYGNPDAVAQAASKLAPYNPVAAAQLQKLSQEKDPEKFNAGLDSFRTQMESMSQRAALNMPRYNEFATPEGGSVYTSQTPGEAAKGQQPQVVQGVGASPKPEKTEVMPEQARVKIQQIDKELYTISKGGDSGSAESDPKMKEAMAKSPLLAALLKSGDPEAKKQYQQTLQEQRAFYSDLLAGSTGASTRSAPQQSPRVPQPTAGRVIVATDPDTGQQRRIER
jgi:hypothetical protein